MVSGTFFRALCAKVRKWAHFAHFGVPKWKMCSISDLFNSFSPKTLKCPFSTFEAIWSLLVPPPLLWEPSGRRLGEVWETAGRRLGGVWKASGRRPGAAWERFAGRLGDVWAHTGGRSWRRRRAQVRRAVVVVGRGGAAGGVAPGSQRFPQEGSLQLSRVGASARQGRRSFLFTPIPKGGLLICTRVYTACTSMHLYVRCIRRVEDMHVRPWIALTSDES